MFPQNGKSVVRLLIAMVAGAILSGILVSLHFRNSGSKTESAGKGSNATAVVAPTNLSSPNLTMGSAPIVSPEVVALVQLMQDWRQKNPEYHILVETSGTEVASTCEVYRFLNAKGEWISRIKNQVSRPVEVTFVVQAESDHIRAYFPRSNQVVDMATEQEEMKALMLVGWKGGDINPGMLLKLARTSFVEVGSDFKALTLVFSGEVFHLATIARDVFLTIKLDDTGKAIGMEQLTLGYRVISKLTYLKDDPAQMTQNAPTIPAGAIKVKKSFEQILHEETAPLLKKTPTRI